MSGLHIGGVVLAVAAVGAGVAVYFLGQQVDRRALERQAKELVEKLAPDATVTSVTCPADIPIKKGHTFDCTAEVEGGGSVPVHVEERDGKGYMILNVDHVLAASKLERAIVDNLKDNGLDAKVDCGARLRPSTPGTKLVCKATAADGATHDVDVTVEDEDGRASWKMR